MSIARHLRLALLLGTLGLLALAGLRAAPADDARASLSAGVDEVVQTLRDTNDQHALLERLGPLVAKHFSFASTTRLSVGPGWRDFTPAQKDEATRLFSALVIRTYAAQLVGEIRPTFTYGAPLDLRGGRIEIPTTILNNNKTYNVAYRMELDPETSRWRIYDVVAEGVSLVGNYRAQFDPLVRKSGADGLLQALREKLAAPPAPATT